MPVSKKEEKFQIKILNFPLKKLEKEKLIRPKASKRKEK